MARKLLIILLVFALIMELAISVGAIFAPDFALHQFKMGKTQDTTFLAYTLAGFAFLYLLFAAFYSIGYGKKKAIMQRWAICLAFGG